MTVTREAFVLPGLFLTVTLLGGFRVDEGKRVALEPGLYRHGYGGVRLEDLVLVTADGCEVLTSYPYQLEIGDLEP